MEPNEPREPTEPLSVYPLLSVMLEQFAEVSWVKLGLRPDIMTGEIKEDLVEARVAIDLVSYLAHALEPQLDDQDRRRVAALTRDLKINFVRRQGEQQP